MMYYYLVNFKDMSKLTRKLSESSQIYWRVFIVPKLNQSVSHLWSEQAGIGL